MTSKHHTSIAGIDIVDATELSLVDGGVFWGPSCPAYPGGGGDDPTWGGYLPFPSFPPIIFC